MTERFDVGPILRAREIPINPGETAGELADRLAPLGAELLSEVLRDLQRGSAVATPQSHEFATYAPMLSKADGGIDFDREPGEICRLVRGLTPWPGCYVDLVRAGSDERRRVNLLRVREGTAAPPDVGPGEVIAAGEDGVEVAARGGSVMIDRLKPSGKPEMGAADFWRGRQIAPGDRLVRTGP
jgi:methionyl-tRNA formyltransferase